MAVDYKIFLKVEKIGESEKTESPKERI